MSKRVLVVAAHPDDEVLGCGGAMARHVQQGDEVFALILAEGITSRDEQRRPDERSSELSELASAAQEANRILGTKETILLGYPDNRMDSVDRLDIIKSVEKIKSEIHPEVVYTHHPSDLNVDHRRVNEAAVTACRPIPGQTVKTLLFFEVSSCTEFQAPGIAPPFVPFWHVDITETLELKLSALDAYSSEMRDWPHSRSIKGVENLVRWRGASLGVAAAESFQLGRHLL